jgi:hypothetical protein
LQDIIRRNKEVRQHVMQLRRQLVELEKEAEKLGLVEESVKKTEKLGLVDESVKKAESFKNGSKPKNELDELKATETPNEISNAS